MNPNRNNQAQESEVIAWHTLSEAEIFARLATDRHGLTTEDARSRIDKYGANRFVVESQRGPIKRFLLQFNNILIYILLLASATTAFLEEWLDTGVIIGVVLINALIGFIQEGKAEKALEAIRRILSNIASVKRDGKLQSLPAEQLVPGDIVSLVSGDKIPADIRLLKIKNFRVDQSMLTGESVPVDKSIEPSAIDMEVADRDCMVYSGTLATYGHATGVVVNTGEQTEIARIGKMLAEIEQLVTPLIRQLGRFGRWLSFVIVALAALICLFGIFIQDYSATEMFLAAVGLAVAAIPEGLPAIMTITLAIGVQRMAQRNAIIRRLPAVETLGSVNVICTDKTGTLTLNEMTIRSVITADHHYQVTGTGYRPDGNINLDGREIKLAEHNTLSELIRGGILCNDAYLVTDASGWHVTGDPTEGSLITLGLKAGHDVKIENNRTPRIDVIPFESEHRFMATMHQDQEGTSFAIIKGAPENIFKMCSRQKNDQGESEFDANYWQQQMEALATQGLRVLAIAFKRFKVDHKALAEHHINEDLTMLGVVGMIDPPREEAIPAVRECHNAGINIKMITGDHVGTATAIAKTLNIATDGQTLSGHDLESMSHSELAEAVKTVDVFARTSPEHKLKLVQALQAHADVVAMTGDGVNDAPALKQADIGIAMGIKGTEVSKEASEMVLVDDNFATIVNAVKEGRTVFDNLKKSILFILPTSGGEAMLIITAILLGLSLPITPVQILWVNMITTVTLALAFAFEPPEEKIMARRPRDPQEPLLSGFLVWRIVLVSLIQVTGSMGLFLWYADHQADINEARTIAVNTLVMFEIFYLFNARFLFTSSLSWSGIFGNRIALYAVGILIIFQMLFTHLPIMQKLFATTDLGLDDWLVVIAVGSTVFFLVEIEKYFLTKNQR